MIVDQLTRQGTMQPGQLYEPPFTGLHYEGIDGLFSSDNADRVVRIVRSVNDNADASRAVAWDSDEPIKERAIDTPLPTQSNAEQLRQNRDCIQPKIAEKDTRAS